MSTATTNSKSASKGGKKSRIIILHLTADALSQFPSNSTTTKSPSTKPIKTDPSPSAPPPDSTDKSSDSNGASVPPVDIDNVDTNSNAPEQGDGKKKKGGSAGTGRKRAPPAIDPDAPPKERGRPGPKKKPRLPDGTIDRTGEKKVAPVNPITGQKLGPKANTGAINAGLRALDRTGKPCRRWERKGLQLKSFTGTTWDLSSWKAPPRDSTFSGDVKSDSGGSSEMKPNESSAVPSERSNSGMDGGDRTLNSVMESSPAPPVAA